jgi:taurine dioxygenase
MSFEIQPLEAPFGAEILGFDPSVPVSEQDRGRIRQAWLDHLVLVFRDVNLTPAKQIELGAMFGECQAHPKAVPLLPEYPELFVLTNVIDESGRLETKARSHWHADLTYKEEPSRAALLYAVEVPPVGGDTLFANMYRAFDTLPEALRRKLTGLKVVHSSSGFAERYAKRRGETPPLPKTRTGEQPANVVHPLVVRHPETHRFSLFLAEFSIVGIEGMGDQEGEDLVKELVAHSVRPDNVYTHIWRPADMVVWDNFCTMHSATGGYQNPPRRRVMHRVTIAGAKMTPAETIGAEEVVGA